MYIYTELRIMKWAIHRQIRFSTLLKNLAHPAKGLMKDIKYMVEMYSVTCIHMKRDGTVNYVLVHIWQLFLDIMSSKGFCTTVHFNSIIPVTEYSL